MTKIFVATFGCGGPRQGFGCGKGVKWDSFKLVLSELERAEIVSAAMGKLTGSTAGAEASGKMLVEAAGFGVWDKLIHEQQQDFRPGSAAISIKGNMGAEAHAKVLAAKRGITLEKYTF